MKNILQKQYYIDRSKFWTISFYKADQYVSCIFSLLVNIFQWRKRNIRVGLDPEYVFEHVHSDTWNKTIKCNKSSSYKKTFYLITRLRTCRWIVGDILDVKVRSGVELSGFPRQVDIIIKIKCPLRWPQLTVACSAPILHKEKKDVSLSRDTFKV